MYEKENENEKSYDWMLIIEILVRLESEEIQTNSLLSIVFLLIF